MRYLLDSNVFIQSKNTFYRFSVVPGFWDWLEMAQNSGILASVSYVHQELQAGGDELADWVKARPDPSGWFLDVTDELTQEAFGDIANWVASQDFKDTAKRDFLGGADPWLIAKAKVSGDTVVTQEALSPEAKKTVPIPNVCQAFSVPWMDVFDLLDVEGARFVLPEDGP